MYADDTNLSFSAYTDDELQRQMEQDLDIASFPGNLQYPAAPCLVTQQVVFKMADDEACSYIKTKVTAPPTVPTKQAEELTGDEARPGLA